VKIHAEHRGVSPVSPRQTVREIHYRIKRADGQAEGLTGTGVTPAHLIQSIPSRFRSDIIEGCIVVIAAPELIDQVRGEGIAHTERSDVIIGGVCRRLICKGGTGKGRGGRVWLAVLSFIEREIEMELLRGVVVKAKGGIVVR